MPTDHQHDDRNDHHKYERFVQLIVEHEPSTRAYLRGLLPTWNDVDEVIQETSLVAWRKFDDFAEGTSFGGWFLTIARFEALRFRRRAARSPLVFANDVWELLERESSLASEEESLLPYLEKCLQRMDKAQRALLLQAHSPGVLMRELAQQAGRSEQGFYKAIQRWRRTLLNCVSKAMAMERQT